MKAVILAGGLGTRISEESALRPKPMIEIGGKPILWHIMKIYSSHGVNDFIICCGYKGYIIKEYFANYFLHMSDVTFDMGTNQMQIHEKFAEPWRVTLVDTGDNTMTGGRLKRIAQYLDKDDFCLTYGDGLSNLDISKLIKFHKKNKSIVTLSAVKPTPHFGKVIFKGNKVTKFLEKDQKKESWINGGFFVCEKNIFKYLNKKNSIFETHILPFLAQRKKLLAYKHKDFWYCMDTLRDKRHLNNLWFSNKAPWKIWNEE